MSAPNVTSPRHQRHWTHTFNDGTRETRLHSQGEPPPPTPSKRRRASAAAVQEQQEQDQQQDDEAEGDQARSDADSESPPAAAAAATSPAAGAGGSAAEAEAVKPSSGAAAPAAEVQSMANDSDGMDDAASADASLSAHDNDEQEAQTAVAHAKEDAPENAAAPAAHSIAALDDSAAEGDKGDAAAALDAQPIDEDAQEETVHTRSDAPAQAPVDGSASDDDSSAASDAEEQLQEEEAEEQEDDGAHVSDDGAAAMDIDDFRDGDDQSDADDDDEADADGMPFGRRAAPADTADGGADDEAQYSAYEEGEDAAEFGEGVAEDDDYFAHEDDEEAGEDAEEEEEDAPPATTVRKQMLPPKRAPSSDDDDDSDVVDLTLSDDDDDGPPPLVAKQQAAARAPSPSASSSSSSSSSDNGASSASSASSAASSPHVAPAIPTTTPTSPSGSPIPDAQFSPEPDADADVELSPEPLPVVAAAAPAFPASAVAPSKPLFSSPFASSPHRSYMSRAQTSGGANFDSSKASFMSPPHRPQKSPSASMDAQALPAYSAAFASFAAAAAASASAPTSAAAAAAPSSNGPAMSSRGRTSIKQWPQPKFYRELMYPRRPPPRQPPAVTRITYQWETLVPQLDPQPRQMGDTHRLSGSLVSHPHPHSFQHAATSRRHHSTRSSFYALERERLARRSEQLARQEQAIQNYAKKRMEPIEDDLSSILSSLSMSDVSPVVVDESNYREQSLGTRDKYVGARVERRMFERRVAPTWKVEALLNELMSEVMREVVIETVTDAKKTSPLSDGELKKSSELLLSPPNKVIADKFNIEITGKELSCLRNLNWLNDETINFYLEMLRERSKRNLTSANALPSQKDRIHFYSSFFYTKLTQGGTYLHKNVARWSRMAKIDVSELDKIILPVHVGHNHWCCAIVNIRARQLEYYDSLGGTNPTCLQYLRRYVADEVRAHRPERLAALDIDSWKEINVKGIPQQNNGSDCGVFTLKFADYASENRPFTFTYKDMPYFRRRIALEIANQKVL